MLQQKTGYEKQELLEKINKYEEKVAILAGEIERLTALFREKERGFEQKSLDFMNEIAVFKGKTREFELKSEFSHGFESQTNDLLRENGLLKQEVLEKARTIENLKKFNSEMENLLSSGQYQIEKTELLEKNQELERLLRKNQSSYQENMTKLIEEIGALNVEIKKRVFSEKEISELENLRKMDY
jgi:hypothetical protein